MAGEDLGTTDENAQNDAEAQGAGTQADAQDGSGMQELNGNSVLDETDTGVTPENNTEDAVTRDADAAFEKQLAERDKEIEALKAQVAEAAKSAEKETHESLSWKPRPKPSALTTN